MQICLFVMDIMDIVPAEKNRNCHSVICMHFFSWISCAAFVAAEQRLEKGEPHGLDEVTLADA
ncbi:unnamed protein product [Amoebophrya sp. A120]|nr:unnamed protein product [Amoebophrya sp. A120]|eukprot:GSA120T00017954001.1